MKRRTFLQCAALAAAVAPLGGLHAAALPGDSLYRLNTALVDTQNQRFTLADLAGKPLLVTMFYGDCNTACPIVIENLKQTVTALGASGKKLTVLMVSLDPFHDTPGSLSQLMTTHKLDPRQFRIAVAKDESQTRMLASALNIKYRVLGSGEINHTTRITLLNGAGSVLASSSTLDVTPDPAFVKQLLAALKPA